MKKFIIRVVCVLLASAVLFTGSAGMVQKKY